MPGELPGNFVLYLPGEFADYFLHLWSKSTVDELRPVSGIVPDFVDRAPLIDKSGIDRWSLRCV
jgi:hypothetical protein